MSWISPHAVRPFVNVTVVAIEGSRLFFARVVNEQGEWCECDADGSMAHGRDGTPIFVQPDFWTTRP